MSSDAHTSTTIDAKESFKDALTRLNEMGRFEGGNLEKAHNNLKDD